MKDLTIIYITASETPKKFANYHMSILEKAIGNYPVISISRKPMEFGDINILDTEPKSLSNIYWQMLQAAKLATTKYIATAEDDTLYPEEHFNFYRPDDDTVAYNQNRLALFNWGKPTYNWRDRRSNCTLIAPRELVIEALEERFAKWPDGTPPKMSGEIGRDRIERQLKISLRKAIDVYSSISVIQINHDNASEPRQRNHRKRLGPIKAFDIPHWGKAADIINNLQ